MDVEGDPSCSKDKEDARQSRRREADRLRKQQKRAAESPTSRNRRLDAKLESKKRRIENESAEQRLERLSKQAKSMKNARSSETAEQRLERQKKEAKNKQKQRSAESTDKRLSRLSDQSQRMRSNRAKKKQPTRNAPNVDVEEIRLSDFTAKCIHCGALHFAEERVQNSVDKDSFGDCCGHGKIKLANGEIVVNEIEVPTQGYPECFKNLFVGNYPERNNFFLNIRKVNSSYALASLSTTRYNFPTNGPYCFKISGQVYYKFNQVAQAEDDETPSNGQLFFIDTEEALGMRKDEMTGINGKTESCFRIFAIIERYLREHNEYAKAYKMMKEEEEEQERQARETGQARPEVKLLFKSPGQDDGTRNLPRSNEVAAVFITNANGDIPPASIVVHERGSKQLKNLNPLDGNVEPMLYPLFYPNGGRGWYAEMKKKNGCTMDQYVKCKLAVRDDGYFVPIHYGRKLFQQWVVDQYARIEWERLGWIYRNQTTLKAAQYKGLLDFLNSKSEQSGAQIGRQVILPSTHYGSPRNMSQHFQDAMRIVSEFGKPHLFITMTASTEDPDLKKLLEGTGQTASDRPDLMARIFDLKKKKLIKMVCEEGMFGQVVAYVYSIEFQKRGVPHIHMLCTLARDDNPNSPEKVDGIIKAEIPDEDNDPVYHDLVVRYMLHGPCKQSSVCMQKGGKCDKHFPKPFCDATSVNEDGKYLYRRRNDGKKVFVRGSWLDNRWVVPHNPRLLKAFRSHINVEKVADYKAVKYLFKYIFKGYDKAYTEMTATDDNGTKVIQYDEVAKFLEQRFIGPVEACWRILGKELQGKSHSVEHLPIHLKGEKVVIFDPNKKKSASDAAEKDDKLEAFFKYCLENVDKKVKYPDMPKDHTWHDKERKWKKRQGCFNTLGRVYSVNPSQSELFHMRLLLHHVESPTSYEDLRTVNGVTYDTYARACLEYGLIRDDQEWHNCMEEASMYKFPRQLRLLFVTILTQCSPAKPEELWEKFKDSLSEDFQRTHTKEDSYHIAYISLHRLLLEQGKSMVDYPSMPPCDDDGSEDIENILKKEDALKLAEEAGRQMNKKQKKVFAEFKSMLKGESVGKKWAYLDGAAGTGKSFVFRAAYHLAVALSKKVTTMAFMGIAATVLPSGRTVHNVFGLPFKLNADSVSSVELGSKKAEDLKTTDVFLWDEAPSSPRYALEIADKM